MATLSITVPDAQVPRVQAALGRALGLEGDATADQVRQFLVDTLVEAVLAQERAEAAKAARDGVTEVGATL